MTNEVEQNQQEEEEALLCSRDHNRSENCCGVHGSDIVHSEEYYWTHGDDLAAGLRLEHADPDTVADMGRLGTLC